MFTNNFSTVINKVEALSGVVGSGCTEQIEIYDTVIDGCPCVYGSVWLWQVSFAINSR